MNVVAEGVETSEQLESLRSLGCDIGQGYFFARPLPPNEFEELLKSGRVW
jgi:EAL domain-containing protein (putative c-di-GMP-specific phosphodiesterase class I)